MIAVYGHTGRSSSGNWKYFTALLHAMRESTVKQSAQRQNRNSCDPSTWVYENGFKGLHSFCCRCLFRFLIWKFIFDQKVCSAKEGERGLIFSFIYSRDSGLSENFFKEKYVRVRGGCLKGPLKIIPTIIFFTSSGINYRGVPEHTRFALAMGVEFDKAKC